MAGTRAYVRGSGGKFAGAKGGKGTKVTYGKAGGFANASFRSRVLANRKAASTANASPATKGKAKQAKPGQTAAQARQSAAKKQARNKRLAIVAGNTAVSSALGYAANGKVGARTDAIAGLGAGLGAASTVRVKNGKVVKKGSATARGLLGYSVGLTGGNAVTKIAAPKAARGIGNRAEQKRHDRKYYSRNAQTRGIGSGPTKVKKGKLGGAYKISSL